NSPSQENQRSRLDGGPTHPSAPKGLIRHASTRPFPYSTSTCSPFGVSSRARAPGGRRNRWNSVPLVLVPIDRSSKTTRSAEPFASQRTWDSAILPEYVLR